MDAHLRKGADPPARSGILPRWLIGPGRQAGKYLVNPLVVRTVAGRLGPTAVVRHVGRRSGRAYATPVYAASMGDDFMIALILGTEADWCRNVWAAGHCTLRLGGIDHALTGPEVVDQATALQAFPAPIRLVARVTGIRNFLRLRRVGPLPNEKHPRRSVPLRDDDGEPATGRQSLMYLLWTQVQSRSRAAVDFRRRRSQPNRPHP